MLLLTLLLACKDYATLCAADDPSVDARACWNKGRERGWSDGYTAAYEAARDATAASCGDTAGETGD